MFYAIYMATRPRARACIFHKTLCLMLYLLRTCSMQYIHVHWLCFIVVYTHVAICLAATLMQGTKEEFGIPAEVDCQAHCYVNSTFRLLSDDSETLQKSGLFEDQVHG